MSKKGVVELCVAAKDLIAAMEGMATQFGPELQCLKDAVGKFASAERRMGFCPKCGSDQFEVDHNSSDISAWEDDTAFPTITIAFECSSCGHRVEVSYERSKKLTKLANNVTIPYVYDGDPDGDLEDEDDDFAQRVHAILNEE